MADLLNGPDSPKQSGELGDSLGEAEAGVLDLGADGVIKGDKPAGGGDQSINVPRKDLPHTVTSTKA